MFGRYVVKQYFCIRFRERNADELKYWTREQEFEPAASKKIFEKTSKKFWQFKNKPYLCIRFRNESYKEEFFERFRYEQASSTILT